MPKRLNIIGDVYDRLTVLEFAGIKLGKSTWKCKCECGNVIVVYAGSMRSGYTKSCGCLTSELTAAKNTTHGHSIRSKCTKTYKIWQGMRSRCNIPSATSYSSYGGKGIRVCAEWNDYSQFLKDMGECPNGYSIERKDSTKNYEPSNCYWLPRKEQNRNKSNTIYVLYEGVVTTIFDLSRKLNIPYHTLRHRMLRGKLERVRNDNK